jgi:flagellar protein FlaG
MQPISSQPGLRPVNPDTSNYEFVIRSKESQETLPSSTELRRNERMGEKIAAGDVQMLKMVEHALKALQGPQTNAELSVHDATNTIMIKIVNSDTGELIREIPSEKTLDIVAKLIEVNGLLIDKKV